MLSLLTTVLPWHLPPETMDGDIYRTMPVFDAVLMSETYHQRRLDATSVPYIRTL